MHDPMTVAFEIPRPWPLVTVWHVDPERDGTDDSCDWFGHAWQRRAERRPWYRHPRWHVWHWRIQLHPWQHFKRWAFDRCVLCGRGYPWGYCPVARGQGTMHHQCSSLVSARETNERLSAVARRAIEGYARVLGVSAAEAVDLLFRARVSDDAAWRVSYAARVLMGTLDDEAAR